jgi:octaprenyl-diphosphate synthase
MHRLNTFISSELPAINSALKRETGTLHPLVRPVAEHILDAGGKRLRPVLMLLTARALGRTGQDLYPVACSLEFLHSATLLHDDILDRADLRRGRSAAHLDFGEHKTVLTGDALLALANDIVARTGDPDMTRCIAQAIIQTATGEILEIAAIRDTSLTSAGYLEIITGKTAYLIQAACELGARMAGADDEMITRAKGYGVNLGIAFQLVDDALDYSSSAGTSGKPRGGDLREGKFTLPLLLFLESLEPEERDELRAGLARETLTEEELHTITARIDAEGFAAATRVAAEEYLARARACLECFSASPEKALLEAVLEYVLIREK